MERKLTYIIILLLSSASCFAQRWTSKQAIENFKNDLMENARPYQQDTFRQGNITLIRSIEPPFFDNARLIKTIEKGKNIIYFDWYFSGTKQLRRTAIFDTLGKSVGMEYFYSKNGATDYRVDHDKAEWVVFDKGKHPWYDLQVDMKARADSLVSKMYGHEFLVKNAVWNVFQSSMFHNNKYANWVEGDLSRKPKKFMFHYDVRLEGELYYDMIEFNLNAAGNFTTKRYLTRPGFEDVPENLKGAFRISFKDAVDKARQLGLQENDPKKISAMVWREEKGKPALIHGSLRYYLLVVRGVIEHLDTFGSTITTRYDVYSFNPWSGDFIEKKKMKWIDSRHFTESGGMWMPDND